MRVHIEAADEGREQLKRPVVVSVSCHAALAVVFLAWGFFSPPPFEFGDPEGEPVLHFHGSPSSRLEGNLAHIAALDRGIRLLSIDRPGFGLSGYQPDRSFQDWPSDVAVFA